MKGRHKYFAVVLLTAALALAGGQARASTNVDFQVSFGGPNSSGTIVFHSQPEVVLVPATKVYYMRNYDCNMYRYGSYWYFVESNRWYRARDYRGPFVYIQSRAVPHPVMVVPVNYRHNWHGPPPHSMAYRHYNHGYKQSASNGHYKQNGNGNNDEAVAQGHYKEKGHGKKD
jgi:hypothetical protein